MKVENGKKDRFKLFCPAGEQGNIMVRGQEFLRFHSLWAISGLLDDTVTFGW